MRYPMLIATITNLKILLHVSPVQLSRKGMILWPCTLE
jgi:hypothetical protein